jgi:hypothetical protein
MMPYATFGLTKVPGEQGEWAAEAILALIAGKTPAEIPLAHNRRANAIVNKELANKLGFVPPPGWSETTWVDRRAADEGTRS